MWPFCGRAAELAAIRSAPSGIVVVGPPGAGKSRLVAQAAGDAAWVRATKAAAELPLGAFAPLLPSSPPEGNALGWATAAVQGRSLVVDDAHLLDSASAALVHHLVAHRRTRVIVTVRSETPTPDAVQALWKDDLLPHLSLAPLTVEETAHLLVAALGGRVEDAAVARIWHASQGNALYLRELVLSGVLAEQDGVWRWRGQLSMTPSLRQTIAGRIGELTPDERSALEFLAYGEPLGADLLGGLASAAAAESLEDRQLVTVDQDGKRFQVRLAHPLYGEVIRAGCGTMRARTMMRRLAQAVTATGLRRREDELRVAGWLLDSGTAAEPGLLLAGYERARVTRDLELAVRLARAAAEAGGGHRALLALGTALFYAHRHEEAEEAFAVAWALTASDEYERMDCGVTRAFNLVWGLGLAGEAFALLDEIEHTVTEPNSLQGVAGTRASLEAFRGDLVTAEARLAQAYRTGPLSERSRRAQGVIETTLLAFAGRAAECLARVAVTAAEYAKYPAGLPSLTSSLLDLATQAALQLGDLELAERYADEGYGLDGDFGTWTQVLLRFGARRAQVLRLRGRPADALERALDTAARLPDRAAYARPCLGELAHAHALLGDVAAAERALDRAVSASVPVGPVLDAPLRFARVWTLAARGDLAGAVAASLAHAEEALPCDAVFALHDVVRLGRPDLVEERLAALPADGPLVAAFVRHATARRPGELDAVSTTFEELGLILYAAEAAAQAARRYRKAGRTREARAAETRALQLARRCQGAGTPALADLEPPPLTPRQREIALLAAEGLTNREIAERLVVSIRTVANTLVAVYERIGVNDRAALAGLLIRQPTGRIEGETAQKPP